MMTFAARWPTLTASSAEPASKCWFWTTTSTRSDKDTTEHPKPNVSPSEALSSSEWHRMKVCETCSMSMPHRNALSYRTCMKWPETGVIAATARPTALTTTAVVMTLTSTRTTQLLHDSWTGSSQNLLILPRELTIKVLIEFLNVLAVVVNNDITNNNCLKMSAKLEFSWQEQISL